MSLEYYIVEKENPNAVHSIHYSLDRAESYIRENVPYLLSINAFTNKSLRRESFMIQVRKKGKVLV